MVLSPTPVRPVVGGSPRGTELGGGLKTHRVVGGSGTVTDFFPTYSPALGTGSPEPLQPHPQPLHAPEEVGVKAYFAPRMLAAPATSATVSTSQPPTAEVATTAGLPTLGSGGVSLPAGASGLPIPVTHTDEEDAEVVIVDGAQPAAAGKAGATAPAGGGEGGPAKRAGPLQGPLFSPSPANPLPLAAPQPPASGGLPPATTAVPAGAGERESEEEGGEEQALQREMLTIVQTQEAHVLWDGALERDYFDVRVTRRLGARSRC